MKKLLVLTTAVLAGAAVAQTAPVAQPAPAAAPAPAAPMAHPMRDRAMTRDEMVQMVRDHFGQMDSNKDGAVTTAEIDAGMGKDFKGHRGRHDMMMMGDPNAAFDRMDANKDGSISRDEFAKAHDQMVERRIEIRREVKDGDSSPRDGKGVRREFRRMHGPGGFGGAMMGMADTNKDGKVTLAEAEAMALRHFDQMDTNHDGQVTPEERRAGRPMIIKQVTEQKKSGS